MQPLTEAPAQPHVVRWTFYLGILLALFTLTTVSVVVTGFDFGPLNVIVALGVSAAKTTLVILYFMHARYSPRITFAVIATALGFFVILVFLTWIDYYGRTLAL